MNIQEKRLYKVKAGKNNEAAVYFDKKMIRLSKYLFTNYSFIL